MVAFGEHPERGEGIRMQGLLGCDGFLGKGLDAVLGHLVDGFHGGKARFPAATRMTVLPPAPYPRPPGRLPPTKASPSSMIPLSVDIQ